jgi:transcriptional regulator with XRE-family HTH domain
MRLRNGREGDHHKTDARVTLAAQGIKQQDIADEFGIDRSRVSQILAGR